MEKKKKIRKIIFLSIIIFIAFIYFITRRPIQKIEAAFSGIDGDKTACAFEFKKRVEFEDHTIKLNDSILIGEFCGGFELIEDKMYTTTYDSTDNTFRIIESDYYLNNQKVIYENKYDYKIESLSYSRIIYFGEPRGRNKELIVEAYDLTTKKYLGVMSQSLDFSYHDYVQKLRMNANIPYDINLVHNPFLNESYVRIMQKDTQETKYVDHELLLMDDVGRKIIEEKNYFWSYVEFGNDNRLYLVCSIWSREYSVFFNNLFNVVYEYDFDTNSLRFKFYFTSWDYDDFSLFFGY